MKKGHGLKGLRLPALAILLLAGGGAAAARPAQAEDAPRQIAKLADAFVAARIERDPDLVYYFDLPASPRVHERLLDRTPEGKRRFDRIVDRLSAGLSRIDRRKLTGSARTLHAMLDEELAASRGLRVCRRELWDVSHFGGAFMDVQAIASMHPVGTAPLRGAALVRWGSMPAFLDRQVANLREGMAAGYSVPKPIVSKVVAMVDAMLALPVEKSPFYAPALRDRDPAFATRMLSIVEKRINPALRAYRDFLERDYLPRARDSLGVSALPNGPACYRALVRRYTTLDRSPEEHFALWDSRNKAASAEVARLGKARYGTDDLAEIAARARAEPDEKYASEEEALAEARAVVAEAKARFAPLFHRLPDQPVRVEPYPDHQRGIGLSPRYTPSTDPAVPALYSLPVEQYARMSRSGNRSTSLHESIPGHHLVRTRSAGLRAHPLMRMALPAAFDEGWAQYAERLADEIGLRSESGRILLLGTEGRAQLFDLGIHTLGWTREEARAFARSRGGGGGPQLDDRLDRVIAFPAQILSYPTGETEILRLREQAKSALGDRFDIRDFHEIVLADGAVPLWYLRENVEAWIERVRQAPAR